MKTYPQIRANTLSATLMLLTCLWSVSFPAKSWGQASTASINGTIRDPSGSGIPRADVVLTNTQTNLERRTVTNDLGIYVFLNISPSEHRLQASTTGFKTARSRLSHWW